MPPTLSLPLEYRALDPRTNEELYHGTRYPLPGGLPHRHARLAQVRSPLPHLVAREVHQVEGLGLAVGGYGWMVLDPHHGCGQPMVADDLGGQLLGGVGDRGALVGGQLGADKDRGVYLLGREVDAHAAPSDSWGGVDVVGGQMHGQMILTLPSGVSRGSFPQYVCQGPEGGSAGRRGCSPIWQYYTICCI